MTTAKRAPKGGTIGINGLQYAGGTFLPSTQLAKMDKSTKAAQSKPVAFWKSVSAFVNCSEIRFGRPMCITASDSTLAYYGTTREQVQGIVDRYNGGER